MKSEVYTQRTYTHIWHVCLGICALADKPYGMLDAVDATLLVRKRMARW